METPMFNFEPTKETLTGQAGLRIAGRILQRLPLVGRLLPARSPPILGRVAMQTLPYSTWACWFELFAL